MLTCMYVGVCQSDPHPAQRPNASPDEVKAWVKDQAVRGQLWDVRGEGLMLRTALRALPTVAVEAASKQGLSGAAVGGIAAGVVIAGTRGRGGTCACLCLAANGVPLCVTRIASIRPAAGAGSGACWGGTAPPGVAESASPFLGLFRQRRQPCQVRARAAQVLQVFAAPLAHKHMVHSTHTRIHLQRMHGSVVSPLIALPGCSASTVAAWGPSRQPPTQSCDCSWCAPTQLLDASFPNEQLGCTIGLCRTFF